VKKEAVSLKQAELVSRIFKSFSHPSRLMILCKLSSKPQTVQALQQACGLEQAPTSQFLARMRKEKRVSSNRRGNRVFYSLSDPRLKELMKTVARLYCR